jgi:UPF0716 protein FxsA
VIGLFALLLLFFAVAELIVIIQVGAAIGAFEAVGLLILVTVLGTWIVKREGLAALQRAQRETESGRMPTDSLLDGIILLVAGCLLIFPGFLSDFLGVLLLLPPVRVLVRRWLVARYGRRITGVVLTGEPPSRFIRRRSGAVVDVDSQPAPDGSPDDGPAHRREPPSLPGPT